MARDQFRHGNPMVEIDSASQGRQRPVGHANGDGSHVLEIVRHGEQKDIHRSLSCAIEEGRIAYHRTRVPLHNCSEAAAVWTESDIGSYPRSLAYAQSARG